MITIFRNISRKPGGRPVEVTVWARLILCLALSGLLHVALLVSGWRSQPAVPVVVGQAMRVALVEVSSEKSAAIENGMTAAATRPPGKAATPNERQEAPVQTENRVQSNVPEEARDPAHLPQPRQQAKSLPQPQKTASLESPPESRKKAADKPDITLTEPYAGALRSAVEEAPPDTRRRDDPEPAKKAQADPDRAVASLQRDAAEGRASVAAEAEAIDAPGVTAPLPETSFVDATPRYQSNPLPEYPYLARQRHWEGEVWLLVTVSAGGRVEDLEVAESSGYGALDKSALNSVRRWRFFPAQKAGVPVASRVKVPVRFQLQD